MIYPSNTIKDDSKMGSLVFSVQVIPDL